MLVEEEKLAHYLAKAQEDPYSSAILEIVDKRIEAVQQILSSKAALNFEATQVFHYLGQLQAYQGIRDLPIHALEYLDALPEEEKPA